MMRAGRRWTWFRIAEAAILLAFAGLTVRNALVFPAIAGVDASELLRYARDLVFEHRLGTSARGCRSTNCHPLSWSQPRASSSL